jgi:hypothetical protein
VNGLCDDGGALDCREMLDFFFYPRLVFLFLFVYGVGVEPSPLLLR